MAHRDLPLERDPIRMESGVHGTQWDVQHHGYFSNPSVAAPLLAAIQTAIGDSSPEVVVDLGGGTGFILRELLKRCPNCSLRLVNLDLSQKQLAGTCDGRIVRVCRSVTTFERSDAARESARFLFTMRSALHYLGRSGLQPFLRHLRSQMKEGEFFVHQTACCDRAVESRCLNRLYRLMETGKWYPTTKSLLSRLEKAGWEITSSIPAPVLRLTSDDLGRRYRIPKHRLLKIRENLQNIFGAKGSVFRPNPDGFSAYLPYRIFICRSTGSAINNTLR